MKCLNIPIRASSTSIHNIVELALTSLPRRLHQIGVNWWRMTAQRVTDETADEIISHQVEEVQVLEALERDGAESWKSEEQRCETTLLRAV